MGTLVTNTVGVLNTTIQSISLTTGIWIIFGNAYFPSSTTFSVLSINDTSGVADNSVVSLVQGSGNIALHIIRYVNVTGANQSWYLIAQTGSSITLSFNKFSATRIG